LSKDEGETSYFDKLSMRFFSRAGDTTHRLPSPR